MTELLWHYNNCVYSGAWWVTGKRNANHQQTWRKSCVTNVELFSVAIPSINPWPQAPSRPSDWENGIEQSFTAHFLLSLCLNRHESVKWPESPPFLPHSVWALNFLQVLSNHLGKLPYYGHRESWKSSRFVVQSSWIIKSPEGRISVKEV